MNKMTLMIVKLCDDGDDEDIDEVRQVMHGTISGYTG